jgi:hypothetical protein
MQRVQRARKLGVEMAFAAKACWSDAVTPFAYLADKVHHAKFAASISLHCLATTYFYRVGRKRYLTCWIKLGVWRAIPAFLSSRITRIMCFA